MSIRNYSVKGLGNRVNKEILKPIGACLLIGAIMLPWTYFHASIINDKIQIDRERNYQERFNQMDLNNDGVLSLEEYLPARLRG